MDTTPYSENPALVTTLRQQLQGEVRFDPASRALYATDASNYRQVPIGVVIPRTVEDVVRTVAFAHQHALPILPRGAGTSLAGQGCNVALVIDTSKYLNRVLKIDPQARLAWVEPGVVLDTLQAAAKPYGLAFGPDPATHSRCTLGGMLGNNASGAHSVAFGTTVENVEALEILTYDGLRLWVGEDSDVSKWIQAGGRGETIYNGLKKLIDSYAPFVREKFPKIRRRVSGYNLDELLPERGFNVARALVGSEGTCVFILQACVRLVPVPPCRVLLVLSFKDIFHAAEGSPAILPFQPLCVEGLDAHMLAEMQRKGKQNSDLTLLPAGGAWLLIEFGGPTFDVAISQAQHVVTALRGHFLESQLFTKPMEQHRVWTIRENGAAALNSVPGEVESYPGWEDAAVAPQQLGAYLRDFQHLLDRYQYRTSLYGHFGEGCVHARITFDLHSASGIKKWRDFLSAAADLVVQYGGSLSGEHGDGQARAEWLPRMFGDELIQAFQAFKTLWDPACKMNPGKIVFPYRADENLRVAWVTPSINTYFSFTQDEAQFSKAVTRCIGVAQCRRQSGGLMCPSYRATHEEAYSTRGRAHLLAEMLRGNPLPDSWGSEQIKDSLERCLACKGCKGDCPVTVDMATYKAEFMAHYYTQNRRPLKAHILGLFPRWIELGSRFHGLINFFTQTPLLRDVVKSVGGIAPQRQIPRLARQSFSHWFAHRPISHAGRPPVILWPDTFNNYFHPQVAIAAVNVLEACGYQVRIPKTRLCCGRPLYDSGQLDLARRLLEEILLSLREDILNGIPIIGLEPSCLSVFRDELLNFFPKNEVAHRLSAQTFLLSEFLFKNAHFTKNVLSRKAILHGHCHHKALWGLATEMAFFKRLGLEVITPESGCCGMAGAFGFEPRFYSLSVQLAETALLPAIRAASEDTLIIAAGFSCREQITQLTARTVLHPAEVVALLI